MGLVLSYHARSYSPPLPGLLGLGYGVALTFPPLIITESKLKIAVGLFTWAD